MISSSFNTYLQGNNPSSALGQAKHHCLPRAHSLGAFRPLTRILHGGQAAGGESQGARVCDGGHAPGLWGQDDLLGTCQTMAAPPLEEQFIPRPPWLVKVLAVCWLTTPHPSQTSSGVYTYQPVQDSHSQHACEASPLESLMDTWFIL